MSQNTMEAAETEAETTEGTEEEEIAKRPAYVESEEAKQFLNEAGKLTEAPSTYDPKKHKNPRKGDFADEVVYMRWNADQNESQANDLLKRAARQRETATQIEKYGDPAQRDKVKKARKLAEQLEALKAQLAEEGVVLE